MELNLLKEWIIEMKRSRRRILLAMAATALSTPLTLAAKQASAAEGEKMDVFTALKTRRSVREYAPKDISETDLKEILKLAMDAPSAANEQPWEFIVLRDKNSLDKVEEINHYAPFAKNAAAAILLCLNEKKEKIKGMGILDMGICAENLMLAAHGMGIGSVFTGIYPMTDRIKGFQKLCDLPDHVIPIGLIVLGYPANPALREADRFNENAIHREKWTSAPASTN